MRIGCLVEIMDVVMFVFIKVAEEKAETFVKELKEKYYHNKGVTQVIQIMLYIVNMTRVTSTPSPPATTYLISG